MYSLCIRVSEDLSAKPSFCKSSLAMAEIRIECLTLPDATVMVEKQER